jgi:Bacterial Ig-like domain (group 3)
VAAASPGGGTPTGTVTFKDGTTTLGTGTLSGGTATFSTTALSVAAHSITAAYGGDTNCQGSTSAALSQVVNPAVASTTTALTSSANPSAFGQSVTFTATVTATGGGTPTGTVTFKDGSTTLGTGTLSTSGGVTTATYATTALGVGNHSITAAYGGDASRAASTSPALTQTVNAANLPPTLNSIANQTAKAGTALNVTLAGSDTDGDTLTYSAQVESMAYHLDQTLGLSVNDTSDNNWGGQQEKWVQGSGATWYYILPSGAFYRWDGVSGTGQGGNGKPLTGTLLMKLDPSYWSNPQDLWNPPISWSVSGKVLTLTPLSGYVGSFWVTATVNDGHGNTASQSFVLTATS